MKSCLISCWSPFIFTSKGGKSEDSRIKSSLWKLNQAVVNLLIRNHGMKKSSQASLSNCVYILCLHSSYAKGNGRSCCTPPPPETWVYWYITARSTWTVLFWWFTMDPKEEHYRFISFPLVAFKGLWAKWPLDIYVFDTIIFYWVDYFWTRIVIVVYQHMLLPTPPVFAHRNRFLRTGL